MGFLAAKKAKESGPTGDLSSRLAAVRRCPAAPREAEGPAAPDQRAGAVAALDACLRIVADASAIMRDAAAHVITAASEPDEGARALLAERYDDARRRIDAMQAELAEEAGSLMGPGAAALDVPLRGAVYAVAPFPLDTGEAGLDLPPPEDGFATHQEVAETLRRVELALERLSRVRAIYTADRAFLSRS